MKRDGLRVKLKNRPFEAKLLHECWCCHAVGLKPGVLETYLGDYGERDFLAPRYQVLELSIDGLCPSCAGGPPPEFQGCGQR
jgi:hypothetical protein